MFFSMISIRYIICYCPNSVLKIFVKTRKKTNSLTFRIFLLQFLNEIFQCIKGKNIGFVIREKQYCTIDILALLQDFDGIFLKYFLNFTVLCGVFIKPTKLYINIFINNLIKNSQK